jgi:hypothetical protein
MDSSGDAARKIRVRPVPTSDLEGPAHEEYFDRPGKLAKPVKLVRRQVGDCSEFADRLS